MTLTCKAVRLRLPFLDDQTDLVGPLAPHVSSCLTCQAEVARYRRLRRSLIGLAASVHPAPEGLAGAIELRLSEAARSASASSPKVARIAAAAVAVGAAATTIAMVRWRRARSAA